MKNLMVKVGAACLVMCVSPPQGRTGPSTPRVSLAQAADVPEAVIQQSFHPYANWTPEFPGYTPGVTITQANVDQYKDILDEALYFFIKNKWVEIKTAPTTQFPLSANYIEASRHTG